MASPGDTVLSTVRTYLKAVYTLGASETDIIASTGFAVVTPNQSIDSSYVGYVLQSPYFVAQVVASSTGVVYPAITDGDLGRLLVAIAPSPDEQSAIARFLKSLEVKIDRLIRNKRRLIALLTEQKQAIIQQAVTRGLDPDVPLKPSGVEWLGEIPAHWELRRNGALFRLRREFQQPTLPILEVSIQAGVKVRDIDNMQRKQVMSDLDKYQVAHAGDIAYNMMRMWQGAVGVVPTDGLVSPAYVVLQPKSLADSRFFTFIYRTQMYMSVVDQASRGIVKDRNRLYWDDYKQLPVPVPPFDEQRQVAEHLAEQTHQVNGAITSALQEIQLIREYRTRLIADVVTGQIDVRELAASLPDVGASEPEVLDAEVWDSELSEVEEAELLEEDLVEV